MQKYKKKSAIVKLWILLSLVANAAFAATPTLVQAPRFIQTPPLLDVSAKIRMTLSDDMRAALLHNIPLFFTWKVQVKQKKSWYRFDKTFYARNIKRSLSYHHNMNTYRVIDWREKHIHNFKKLSQAIDYLGKLSVNIKPIPYKNTPDSKIYGRVKFSFNAKKLPATLIPTTLFSSDWEQNLPWHSVPITKQKRP